MVIENSLLVGRNIDDLGCVPMGKTRPKNERLQMNLSKKCFSPKDIF